MKNTVAIVTGAGRGIGRAIARRFAAQGVFVIPVARSQEDLAQTAGTIESDGGRCAPYPADLSHAEQVTALVDFAQRQAGGVDMLINNAGMAHKSGITEFDDHAFQAMIGVNVAAPFYAARAVWPIMRQRGGGVIVNISSIAAQNPFPGLEIYGASKAFVDGLTRGLAREGQPHGIRVYGVAPGAVETQMLRASFPEIPADQCLQPEDVAHMVWTLTLPACRYSVGQTIIVNKVN